MSGVLAAGATVLALLTSALVPQAAASDPPDGPPTERVRADLARVNGSGCPQGTVAVAVAPDNSGFNLFYSSHTARVGLGSAPVDFRKNCQVALDFRVPDGWTIAVQWPAEHHGYAYLEEGASATLKTALRYEGQEPGPAFTHEFSGPYDELLFVREGDARETPPYRALCPEDGTVRLVVDSRLRVLAGTSDPETTSSFIGLDATSWPVGSLYDLSWSRCPGE
ncbi:DUF4360 domain-containing protein [Streptomyces carminius]|nr:DUF4360 domain-containing protein [Streptomyces carminius]